MKNYKVFIFALVSVAVAGCHSDFNTSPTIGVNISLHATETVMVSDIQTPACAITVLSIHDSRCPADVECIWAGEVKVTFGIDGATTTVGKGETKPIYWRGQNLKLTLVDVTPYPTTKNRAEKKSVIFIIQH